MSALYISHTRQTLSLQSSWKLSAKLLAEFSRPPAFFSIIIFPCGCHFVTYPTSPLSRPCPPSSSCPFLSPPSPPPPPPSLHSCFPHRRCHLTMCHYIMRPTATTPDVSTPTSVRPPGRVTLPPLTFTTTLSHPPSLVKMEISAGR